MWRRKKNKKEDGLVVCLCVIGERRGIEKKGEEKVRGVIVWGELNKQKNFRGR